MRTNLQKITNLKNLLCAKYGSAQSFASTCEIYETGVKCLDELGIKRGGIHEFVGESPSSGAGWIIHQVLSASRKHLALIDGRGGFDPNSIDDSHCLGNLLWVKCRHAIDAIKAADWLLRDGNLRLILLDLRFIPRVELRRITTSSWYRLRALAAETDVTLLVFTQEKEVPRTDTRILFQQRFPLSVFDQKREEIEMTLMVESSPVDASFEPERRMDRAG